MILYRTIFIKGKSGKCGRGKNGSLGLGIYSVLKKNVKVAKFFNDDTCVFRFTLLVLYFMYMSERERGRWEGGGGGCLGGLVGAK